MARVAAQINPVVIWKYVIREDTTDIRAGQSGSGQEEHKRNRTEGRIPRARMIGL